MLTPLGFSLLRQLAEWRIPVQDQETAADLYSMGLSAEIVGFCRAVKDDVQKAADAGCKAIVMEIMAFPRGLQALGWSFEDATGKMIDVSHFAKRKGLRVTVFFVCVLQAPLDFSKKFIQKVLAEGAADGVCIPDTFGTCMPNTIYHYVRKLREWTDKPIEIHPHNMYSLGAADALAGVMAGAEVVHVCVNGLGEGAGNAPLEAVVLDLPLMLGIDTGVRLEKIYELCKLEKSYPGLNCFDYIGFIASHYWEVEADSLDWIIAPVAKVWRRIGPYVLHVRALRNTTDYYLSAEYVGNLCIEWRDGKGLPDEVNCPKYTITKIGSQRLMTADFISIANTARTLLQTALLT